MHTDESDQPQPDKRTNAGRVSWIRLVLGIVIGFAGFFIIVRNVDLVDVAAAFQDAVTGYIVLALIVILITILVKTWRWQLIFRSGAIIPGIGTLFWALVTGQFFNILIPFRTGEIARMVSLEQQAGISKTKTLSTLVIEKTLDIVGLLLTIVVILPFMAIPDEITSNSNSLAILALVALPLLILITFNARRLEKMAHGIGRRLPLWIQSHFIAILAAGLEGLSALKSGRLVAGLSLVTFIIVILSFATPLILFQAFGLPLGIREAIIINLLVTLATAPPSTPGRIVIFLAIVRLAMEGFGVTDPGVILSYSLAFLLVVYAPSLILGGLAITRSRYKVPVKISRGTE